MGQRAGLSSIQRNIDAREREPIRLDLHTWLSFLNVFLFNMVNVINFFLKIDHPPPPPLHLLLLLLLLVFFFFSPRYKIKFLKTNLTLPCLARKASQDPAAI